MDPAPLKIGIADDLNRLGSMFGVTVPGGWHSSLCVPFLIGTVIWFYERKTSGR